MLWHYAAEGKSNKTENSQEMFLNPESALKVAKIKSLWRWSVVGKIFGVEIQVSVSILNLAFALNDRLCFTKIETENWKTAKPFDMLNWVCKLATVDFRATNVRITSFRFPLLARSVFAASVDSIAEEIRGNCTQQQQTRIQSNSLTLCN